MQMRDERMTRESQDAVKKQNKSGKLSIPRLWLATATVLWLVENDNSQGTKHASHVESLIVNCREYQDKTRR